MGLIQIDLNIPPKPIEWLVPGLFPFGHLSFIGAAGGTFKTATAAYLMVQMARPEGKGEFLGRPVQHGASIYLNFDSATGDAQTVRYWLEPALKAFPDANRDLIKVIEPNANTYEVDPEVMLGVELHASTSGAKLIVFDSFEACWQSLDSIKAESIRPVLRPLERMAAERNLSVLVVDHLPKLSPGELPEQRSLKGSVAKRNAARAVHLFSKLPSDKAGGTVYRWMVDKMSFGLSSYAFGVEVQRSEEALHLIEVPLPDDSRPSRLEGAIQAIVNHFDTNPGMVHTRQSLLDIAKAQGLAETKAKEALAAAIERVQPEEVRLGGRGNPVGYRSPSYSLEQVTKIENTVPEPNDLGHGEVTQIARVTEIPTPKTHLEQAWDIVPMLPQDQQGHWRTRLNRDRDRAANELLAKWGGGDTHPKGGN